VAARPGPAVVPAPEGSPTGPARSRCSLVESYQGNPLPFYRAGNAHKLPVSGRNA